MIQKLRENKNHGTKEYSYCQYTISNLPYGFHFPIHWHDEMEIVYVQQGQLLVNVEGEDYNLTAGQVLIINARQLHLMVAEDLNLVYSTLLFPLEFISFQADDWLEQTVFRPLRAGKLIFPNVVSKQILTEENLELLRKIVYINEQQSSFYQMETRLLILRFLMEVLRNTSLIKTGANKEDDMQRQMLEYIRANYQNRISLSDLAKQFHLSPKYVSRYFKEKFHLTFSDYVDHLRMSHAKELLENTDLSVTEIAMECGFSSVSFFIRRFTGTNGCSPLKWRKKHKDDAQIVL